MFLLDTNHCSLILDGNPVGHGKLLNSNYSVSTCVIVKGELIFMAENSIRKQENLRNLNNFLSKLEIHGIDTSVAKIYGELKACLRAKFGPKEKRRKFKLSEIGISDNDLWIASIAVKHDLTVLTSDTDFERMKQVHPIKTESWEK